jgi:hypothetical protein
MEVLKQLLGSEVDEEVEIDGNPNKQEETKQEETKKDAPGDKATTVSEKKDEESKDNGVETKKEEAPKNDDTKLDNKTDTSEKGDENMALFEEGWFNSETGEVDESKIKNPEALAAIQTLTAKVKQEKEQRLIADSLSEELKNYSLNVSEDTLKRVLDMSNVKLDKDNKVTGVKEALEALKTKEPGFFKDKEKESNPLNEGFNPVEKRGTDNVNSFSQAFKLMEEIG